MLVDEIRKRTEEKQELCYCLNLTDFDDSAKLHFIEKIKQKADNHNAFYCQCFSNESFVKSYLKFFNDEGFKCDFVKLSNGNFYVYVLWNS